MRDIRNAPLFLRLGSRLRGPAGTPVCTENLIRVDDVRESPKLVE
jgi:hypothetical protein